MVVEVDRPTSVTTSYCSFHFILVLYARRWNTDFSAELHVYDTSWHSFCPVMTEGSKSRFTEAGKSGGGAAGASAPNYDWGGAMPPSKCGALPYLSQSWGSKCPFCPPLPPPPFCHGRAAWLYLDLSSSFSSTNQRHLVYFKRQLKTHFIIIRSICSNWSWVKIPRLFDQCK